MNDTNFKGKRNPFDLSCPVPISREEQILLAHGEGARLTRQLVRNVLLEAFDNPILSSLSDGAVLPRLDGKLVLTTDSYVVSPLFFPGGDIGRLAVYGTVNDLSVSGAIPLYLTLALILEEGFSLETLKRVVGSIQGAAKQCGVQVVAGDTKVVPRGMADGLFINTTGLGVLRQGIQLGPDRVQPGDKILVSGNIADHGIAILGSREGFQFESLIESDAAPLIGLIGFLIQSGVNIHWMRDPTRGGVAATLHECAEASGQTMLISELDLPVHPAVRGACEILGLDPMHVANEGKVVLIVGADQAEQALVTLRVHPLGKNARLIGTVTNQHPGQVLIKGALGTIRVLDEPSGSPLPRIC